MKTINKKSKPIDSLAILPLSLLPSPVGLHIGANPVLLAFKPGSQVLSAISPLILTVALLLAMVEGALVHAAILVSQRALPMHLASQPLALVDCAIAPFVGASALHLLLEKLA